MDFGKYIADIEWDIDLNVDGLSICWLKPPYVSDSSGGGYFHFMGDSDFRVLIQQVRVLREEEIETNWQNLGQNYGHPEWRKEDLMRFIKK